VHQRLAYRLVDVFTRERFGGNPLAVFPEADGVDPALMQRIARELNLSEATFVLAPTRPDCDFRVRIFTPRAEVPMAGHPTLGTAFVLAEGAARGRARVVFEEGVGPVPVEQLETADGRLWRMTQPAPRFGPRLADPARAAAALGLAEADLDPELPIEVVATGAPFLLVPVRDVDALGRARIMAGPAWEAVATEAGVGEVHVFARMGAGAARARTFAPAFGIAEDPATGSAVGPLGGYLLAHGALAPGEGSPARLEVIQGIEMGRPSLLFVEVEGSREAVGAVHVAGACVAVGGGWIEP